MNGGGEGNRGNVDLYAVLGLHKECTPAELKNAYKKLAMRWHPDRYSGSGNSKYVEEANKKFQAIQEAYSVLSDSNKRFLYDVGAYDEDDDDNNNGMGEFLNEMLSMMNNTKPNEYGKGETFEELQDLFEEMFNSDMESFGSSSTSRSAPPPRQTPSTSSSSSSSPYVGGGVRGGGGGSSSSNGESSKRSNSLMNNYGGDYWQGTSSNFSSTQYQNFCFGVEQREERDPKRRVGARGGATSRLSNGRKPKGVF